MEIKQYLTTVNYTPSTNKQNKYIVIHYTANNGDTAQGNANYFHSINRNASANYFVDENEIVQVVPDNYIAWHCGAKTYKHPYCRNNNSIGIEMCSRKDKKGNYYFKDGTVNNSIQLVCDLMNKYNIPIENVIRHYDVTKKLCPLPYIDDAEWNKYKSLLRTALKGSNLEDKKGEDKMYQNINEVPEWARNTINKLINKGCFPDVNKLALTNEMVRIFVIMDRWIGLKV
ncbi:MAG TPA: N-acetylmuramoyl-L-alanine amidase [Lachnospiraceae bacterium]|nr:N-acetylmuramoyl-L-alanine amidase [Lachnospiraceae bacterium]